MVTVNTKVKTSQLPDGPTTLPLLQLINWIAHPFEYMEQCTEKYGDVFTMRILGVPPFVVVANPQGIKEIFSTDSENFEAGRTNSEGGNRLIIGDNSLMLMDGPRHQKERKLLMPPFHGDSVKQYAQSICDITEGIASHWQIGQPFISAKITQEIALRVIMQVLFGFSEGEKCEQLRSLLAHWLHITASPIRLSFIFLKFLQIDLGAWSPWGDFIRTRQKICDLFQSIIIEKRSAPEQQGNDILSLMLSATDEDGQTMTNEQLQDEILTILSAGHETTANGLAWAFYWLEKVPRVKEKLLQEIDSLGIDPDPIAISRLPYLTAFCKETLRIYPVVEIAIGRIAKRDMEMMGRFFKAGTSFVPSIYCIHHREDLYPDSKQFKPERFLEYKYASHEFIPFGGGVRMCLGHAFALLEMKLVIATIVSKYNLKLASDELVKPVRRGATIAPSNGVPLILTGFRKSVS